jgi:hypothetical protein
MESFLEQRTRARGRMRPLCACLGLTMAAGIAMFPAVDVAAKTTAIGSAGQPTIRTAPPADSRRARARDEALARAAAPHGGVTIAVDNCNDSGTGSLRDALAAAGDGDTVDLTALTCSTITLTSGAVQSAAENVTIKGPGSNLLTIDGGYDAGYYNSAIYHFGTGTLSITGVTITDAKYLGSLPVGGAIYSEGSVYLGNSVVSGCGVGGSGAIAAGGGIYAKGNVVVKYSVINGNFTDATDADARGGGIYAHGGVTAKYSTISNNVSYASPSYFAVAGGIESHGNVSISATTISGNLATRNDAALVAVGGNAYTVEILNSTISGNTAFNLNGGVYVNGPVSMQGSTIAFNTAGSTDCSTYGYSTCATGLHVRNGYASELQSSIIARNTVSGTGADVSAVDADFALGADNIIQASFTTVPADTITADPMLFPLAENGGLTRTHALKPGSPAIDAGNNGGNFTNDQRGSGFPRVVGANADIGAFELQGPHDGDFIFVDGFDP